jgi:uncharacterized membrane protein
MLKMLFKGFLILSGVLFWAISLSLVLPVSGLMGWASMLGIYWIMFGIPLSLMLVVIFVLGMLFVKLAYSMKKNKEVEE